MNLLGHRRLPDLPISLHSVNSITQNGIKKVATLVSDYGPGMDAGKFFKEREANGGMRQVHGGQAGTLE